ncbi:uncharacterized protein JCM10292_000346 [Rhodotorula paludigena]|uniref:uncharacterized protein n=1 Tax=Rhodotorula paludigena TaxID=86838 RepID=UPI00317D258C
MGEYTRFYRDEGALCTSFSFQSTAQPFSLPLLAVLSFLVGGLASVGLYAPTALAVVAIFLLVRRGRAVRETLKIFPGLSVQLESESVYAFTPSFRFTTSASTNICFVPNTARITSFSGNGTRRVVLNEGLQGAQVRPYLALLHGPGVDKLQSRVIFPTILPRLEDLTPVLQEAQRLLAEPAVRTISNPPSP